MCYLPKITFYLYFGFFLLGYVWIFIIFFYNRMSTNVATAKLSPENYRRPGKPVEFLSDSERHNQHAPPAALGPIEFDLIQKHRLSAINQESFDHEFRALEYDLLKAVPLFGAGSNHSFDTEPEPQPLCVQIQQPHSHFVCHFPADSGYDSAGFSAEIVQNQTYRSALTEALATEFSLPSNLGAEDRYFIDIGSGNGYYSMMGALYGWNVLAFEPINVQNRLLHLAIHKQRTLARKILLFQACVSSRTTFSTANLQYLNPANRGSALIQSQSATVPQIPTDQSAPPIHSVTVQLNDLLNLEPFYSASIHLQHFKIILKLSANTHECEILNSAAKVFLRLFNVPKIYLDLYHRYQQSEFLKDKSWVKCRQEMSRNLSHLGYKLKTLDGRPLKQLNDWAPELADHDALVYEKVGNNHI